MYLALYRKYRPSTFDDVISQEHTTTTLKNQIATGQIAHAYLFTGTRGTGKTSCAKIMAKAVNCLSPENGNPCGKCAVCKAIEEGSTDIIEIDAASNNGVDNIRQIRDEIIYTPIDCKYKVYIIDEVHMLSPGAFNALLKTLEEPPPHVIFILATTEYYKIPATILSRCQQFLFSKIDAGQSAKRLLEIAEKENISLDPAAAHFIARLADGAMRDALSLLDQCISISDKIDEELVRQCSGAADSEYLFAVSQAAVDRSPADALAVLDKLIFQGKDISRFIEELTAHYRNLMLEKTAVEELVKASGSELEQYRRQSKVYSLDEIMRHIDLISDSLDNINRMKQTGQARLLTEQLLIRLTTPKLTNDASALAARIGSLESKVERLKETGAAVVREARSEERSEENRAIPQRTEEKPAESMALPPKTEEKAAESTALPPKTEEKAVDNKAVSQIIEERAAKSAEIPQKTEEMAEKPASAVAKEKTPADNIKTAAEAEEPQFFYHETEPVTGYFLPVYDDVPLPEPPPEEAFEGGYGNDMPDEDLLPAKKPVRKAPTPQADKLKAAASVTESLKEEPEKAPEKDTGKISDSIPENKHQADSISDNKHQADIEKRSENISEKITENITDKTAVKANGTTSAAGSEAARPVPEADLELPAAAPLPQWQEIISGLQARSRGLMKSSQAYLYDGKIYINATASSEKVLKDGAKAEELRKRVKEVLGGEMELFILKTPPPAEDAETDMITPFLQKAESLGIEVKVK
ncbi:MAG: DNA polymerase III subunit gamma/tau [Ruminococcaceae bacterium]|nr:DNA polymerase III subunit gamma/tau [Oscillospiraceae bacterium]